MNVKLNEHWSQPKDPFAFSAMGLDLRTAHRRKHEIGHHVERWRSAILLLCAHGPTDYLVSIKPHNVNHWPSPRKGPVCVHGRSEGFAPYPTYYSQPTTSSYSVEGTTTFGCCCPAMWAVL